MKTVAGRTRPQVTLFRLNSASNYYKTPSEKELSTANFNTSKEKALTNDFMKGSIFDEVHFNTGPKQHNQSKREAENGNDINDDNAKAARDGMRRVTFRRTERFKHNIFSLKYDHFLI